MSNSASPVDLKTQSVALFVTCLADLVRPNVGFAAVKLLAQAGADVVVPEKQTCCGQPALNSGNLEDARALARQMIEAFEGFDWVVAPSGSCAGTIRVHYPELFKDDEVWKPRAEALAAKTYELTSFLSDVVKADLAPVTYNGVAAYHDSCAGLRELGIKQQPRDLLANVEGLQVKELSDAGTCCGFGGLFSVKHGDVSGAIVDKKTTDILATNADTLLGGDLGCLMNMSGRLTRVGSKVRVYHVAEVLAGMTDVAALGEDENGGEN